MVPLECQQKLLVRSSCITQYSSLKCNILDGTTIHAAFDVKYGFHQPMSEQKMAQFRDNLSELKIVIIDEMSMVGADMLYNVHKKLCEIFCSEDLYADKSIFVVGDLLQLRPVDGTYIFNKPRDPNFKAFADGITLWQTFEPFVLRENHRQGNGSIWANHLNDMRVGKVTEEALELLQTRVTDEPFLEEDAMHVFYTNKEVTEHNFEMLDRLPGVEDIIAAQFIHPDYWTPDIKKKDGTVDTTNFVAGLYVKVRARVSMVFNISLVDGLVNGALGTVVGIEKCGKDEVTSIIVAFDCPETGERQRERYPMLSKKYADKNGTPIMRHDFEYPIKSKSGKPFGAKARVIQFPLRLSWASTAHKMQVRF